MVKVVLTANLQKYYPEREFRSEARTVREVLAQMEKVRPQFTSYILEDSASVRRHVNLFKNGQLLPKDKWDVALAAGDTLHIMQALSGG